MTTRPTKDTPGPLELVRVGPEVLDGFTGSPSELPIRQYGPIRRWIHAHPVWFDGIITALFILFYGSIVISNATITNISGPMTASESEIAATSGMIIATESGPPWFGMVTAILAVTGVALRRVRPRFAFLLIIVASALGLPFQSIDPIATPVAVYAVAAYRPRRDAWIGFSLSALVTVAWVAILHFGSQFAVQDSTADRALSAPPAAEIAFSVMLLLTFMVPNIIALSTGRSVRSRRSYERALRDRANALASERDQQAVLAAQHERNRIAREMHDVVAHSLTVMIALADGAEAALPKSPERAQQAIIALGETGRTALVEARRIFGVLRVDENSLLSPQPGGNEIDALVDQFRAAGMTVRLTRSGPVLPPDPSLQLAAYRIIQESLTNALRYAGPRATADVTLASIIGHTTITVLDNGPATGVSNSVGAGKGVVGLGERVALFGGSIKIGPRSDLGHGWSVVAEIPWDH